MELRKAEKRSNMTSTITLEKIIKKIKYLQKDGHLIVRTSDSFIIDKICIYKWGISYNAFEIINESYAEEIEKLMIGLRNDFNSLIGMTDYFDNL